MTTLLRPARPRGTRDGDASRTLSRTRALPVVLARIVPSILVACSSARVASDPAQPYRILFDSNRSGTEEIHVMDPDGSNVRQLTHVGREEVTSWLPDWSPDRRRIVFSSNRTGPWDDLYVMDAGGGNVRQLTDTPEVSEHDAAWSPDGRHILYSAQPRARIAADGTRRDREPARIWIIDADGYDARPLTSGSGRSIRPSWSPDGSTIAFASDRHTGLDPDLVGTEDGDLEIYRMDRDGKNIRRLTEHPGTVVTPEWSPDGRRIVFQGFRTDGPRHIYVMNADGSDARRLTNAPRVDGRPAWSPDGREIVFNCGPEGRFQEFEICLIRADGSGFRTLTDNDALDGHPDWW